MFSLSEGKIINAASTDLAVLDFGNVFIIHMLFQPFAAIVHWFVLYLFLGWQAFIAIGIMVTLLLILSLNGKLVTGVRAKSAIMTDTRLKILYDTIAGI